MKILMLDFDGVLNSKQHLLAVDPQYKKLIKSQEYDQLVEMKMGVNYNNMWALNYILKRVPGLQIVISSAWGAHYTIEQFNALFKIFKMGDDKVIGITPRKMSSYRCNEIHWWLEEQNEPEEHDCPVDISDGPCGQCDSNAMRELVEIDWLAVDDHVIFNIGEEDKKNEYLTDSWVGLTLPDAFNIIKHFDPKFREPVIMI